jgi:hypothetical protein
MQVKELMSGLASQGSVKRPHDSFSGSYLFFPKVFVPN